MKELKCGKGEFSISIYAKVRNINNKKAYRIFSKNVTLCIFLYLYSKGGIFMINVLIVSNSIEFSKNLIKIVNYISNNIRICGLSTEEKETLDILNRTDNIDIVLLDSKTFFLNRY